MEVYCIVSRKIRLSDPTPKVQLPQPLAHNNELAHSMRVEVVNDDGSAADLTGIGVTASFLKADNVTVEPINGTTSGNVAEVILPASCYVTPGRFKFTLNLSKTGGYTRTALWVEGIVERNTTEAVIDPGTPVSNISQAIANANAAAASATSAASAASAAAAEASGHFLETGRFESGSGQNTDVTAGNYTAAIGRDHKTTGSYSAAMGYGNTASGNHAMSLGKDSTAKGYASQTQGIGLVANGFAQHVSGAYNVADTGGQGGDDNTKGQYVEIVGNGNGINSRSNARTLDWSGNEVLAGTITAAGVNLNTAVSALQTAVDIATVEQTMAYLNIT